MSFERDFRNGERREVGRRLDKLGRAAGLETLGRLIRKTPVDTSRAQANWNLTVGTPDFSEHNPPDAGASALRAGRVKVQSARFSRGDAIWCANGVPYIEALENGHSSQAPNGMVRLTVLEMEPVIRRIGGSLRRGG